METGNSGTKDSGNGNVSSIKNSSADGPDGNKSGVAKPDIGTDGDKSGPAGQPSGVGASGESGKTNNETLGTGSGVAPAAKKRGRPPGSASAPLSSGKTKSTLDLKSADAPKRLARTVAGFHAMAAKFTKIPLFILEPEESKDIADAIIEVAAQHNIVISARAAAWSNLFGVACAVYGPRVAMVAMMAKASRAGPPPQAANVRPQSTADANEVAVSNVLPITGGKMKFE